MAEAFDRVHLAGTGFDPVTEGEVVALVREALAAGRGGRIVTPNVDILRQAEADPRVRALLADADLVVADGMPLIWASRLGGTPLPERVAGSSLIWSLSEGLGRDGRSIFVVGGHPADATPGNGAGPAAPTRGVPMQVAGAAGPRRTALESSGAAAVGTGMSALDVQVMDVPQPDASRLDASGLDASGLDGSGLDGSGLDGSGLDGAARAADRLAERCPGLRIAGTICPDYGFERDEQTYADVCAKIADARPDCVFVGVGFPKQEILIDRLRPLLPQAWFVGCGAAVNFVAGDVNRAPRWMQRSGLEWVHRLGTDPRRLARRYLRHDTPYALRLLASSARR